jgi:hypothetical protein
MAAFYTLFYIAPPEAAEAIAFDEDAIDRWPSVWLRHIGDLELVALWNVIDEKSQESEGTLMADLIFQGSDEGPFVMRVPPEFIAAVASIPDDEAPDVATAWSRAAELPDWRWRQEEVTRLLNELRTFAQQALASGQPVLQVAEI